MKINKILLEDTSKKPEEKEKKDKLSITLPGSEEKQEKIRNRVVKVLRVAKEAREAAQKARANGNDQAADKLEEEADQLEKWADTVYDPDRDGISHGQSKSKGSQSSSNGSANDAHDDEGREDLNQDETAEEAAERAQEAADSAERAAQAAQKAADEAKAKAEETAKNGSKEEAEKAAQAAEAAQDAADEAADAAEEAQAAADKAQEAAENGDADGAKEAADEAEEAAERADKAADEAVNGDSSDEDADSDSSNSGSDSSSDSSSDSNSDSTSDSDSDSGSDSSDSKSNSKSSSSSDSDSDSGSDSNSDEDSDSDSDDEDQDSDSDSSGSSSSQSKSSNTIENPFDLEPKHAPMSAGIPGQQNQNQQDEFDNMMQILKMLRGGESDGARAALNDILKAHAEAAEEAKKQESLQEKLIITKAIDEVDDDSFDDIVNQALDNINEINPVTYADNRESRVKEIKNTLDNPITKRELDREDRMNKGGGGEKIKKDKARAREIEKYRLDKLPNTKQFKLDLYDAIYDQVDKVKKQKKSWGAINKRHQNSDIIVQGKVIRGEFEEVKPTIQVYLDSSSSFKANDIQRERALMGVLAEFEERDEIKTQIYYFADNVFDNYASARAQGGTAAWPDIMKQIQETNPANVLIVTDDDMNWYAQSLGQHYRVEGCVWYIWKGSRAANLPKYLDGETGLKEYMIEW